VLLVVSFWYQKRVAEARTGEPENRAGGNEDDDRERSGEGSEWGKGEEQEEEA
jgi:hypothetical protein